MTQKTLTHTFRYWGDFCPGGGGFCPRPSKTYFSHETVLKTIIYTYSVSLYCFSDDLVPRHDLIPDTYMKHNQRETNQTKTRSHHIYHINS